MSKLSRCRTSSYNSNSPHFKKTHKSYLKTKAWGVVKVVARGQFR